MPENWMDDANELNNFAWWCFENKVNYEEAYQFAQRGIELAEPGLLKAYVLDTAAELCNVLGTANPRWSTFASRSRKFRTTSTCRTSSRASRRFLPRSVRAANPIRGRNVD